MRQKWSSQRPPANGARCGLADWTHIRQDAAAAFVFDLITLPADSDLARLVTDAPAH